MSEDFRTDHLTTDEQRQVAAVVLSVLPEDATGGGCRAFYTPAEWADRQEEYGCDSVLILCHDGGALATYCNLDYCDYDAIDKLMAALHTGNYWLEQCTPWYSAVYKYRVAHHDKTGSK